VGSDGALRRFLLLQDVQSHASFPGVGSPFVGRLRYLDECASNNRGQRDRGFIGPVLGLEATAAFDRRKTTGSTLKALANSRWLIPCSNPRVQFQPIVLANSERVREGAFPAIRQRFQRSDSFVHRSQGCGNSGLFPLLA
jgi:hypothetical protein